MLQGTFDTLALTEVLGLLAQSGKTGALWLEAGSVQGRVYLADGRCCAAESTDLVDAVDTEAALVTRLVDVCFTLARQAGGAFRFAADESPAWKVTPGVAIEEAMTDLDRLLGEWREIQLVIPSLEVRPRLAPELAAEEIILDQERWRLLVTLDGRRTVRAVMNRTERGVLEVCNVLKELVEQGAVEILPEAATPPAPQAAPVSEPVADPAVDAAVDAELLATIAELEPLAADAEAAPRRWREANAEADDEADRDSHRDSHHDSNPELHAEQEDSEPERHPHLSEMPDPFAGADEEAEHVPGRDDAFVAPPGAGALDEGDARDRGALLRLFSALRDQ